MKRIWLTVVAGLVLTVMLPMSTVSAHVLKQDNGVTSVLHVVPFDAPVTGEKTKMEFEFSNDTHTFSLQRYDVKLAVMRQNKLVQTMDITAAYFGTATLGVAYVTFTDPAVYNLQITGTPKGSGDQAFAMAFPLRVTNSDGSMAAAKTGLNGISVLTIGFAGIAIFAMFAVSQISRGGRYRNNNGKE